MKVLIPGSFDPITLGHVNIIERAAKLADTVYVAVMNNDSSKHDSTLSSKTYLFNMEERTELVRLSVAHVENVIVISRSGMLIDLFDELSVDTVIKGIRSDKDLEYEMIHAEWNKAHNPRFETVFLPCDENYSGISSTLVRERIKSCDYEGLCEYMSAQAIEYLKEINKKESI